MKTYLACIPCFIKQSLEATRMATDDEAVHIEVIKKLLTHLKSISFTDSPPELSRKVHCIIRDITKSEDPYKKVKDKSNKLAKEQYPLLKKMVEEASDPLLMAIKIAIAGNVIDFGTYTRFNVEDIIDNLVKKNIDEESYQHFKKSLCNSKTILYLADNAGEIFFDKLLIKELLKQDKKVIYVVRANPIINDATIDDVRFAGIDKLATVIESDVGQKQSAPGVVLNYSSKKFLDYFESSDMIISKGQGNYEGLSNVNRDVFFMLVIKCPLVARDIGDEVGKFILKVKK
jgi:damage-control phosphatase, subfamily I